MPHFGHILKGLRTRRGLTQAALAAKAQVSVTTISRGEGVYTCDWSRSIKLSVFRALDHAHQLSRSERSVYLDSTELTEEEVRQASPVPSDVDDEKSSDPDRVSAHAFLDTIIQERGAKKAITALEGIAAAWEIDLPPRIREQDIKAGTSPYFVLIHPPKRVEDREIVIHEPIPLPTPPASLSAQEEDILRKAAARPAYRWTPEEMQARVDDSTGTAERMLDLARRGYLARTRRSGAFKYFEITPEGLAAVSPPTRSTGT